MQAPLTNRGHGPDEFYHPTTCDLLMLLRRSERGLKAPHLSDPSPVQIPGDSRSDCPSYRRFAMKHLLIAARKMPREVYGD